MAKRVIVSVINDLSTDQRVKKVCDSLLDMGYEVLLVGRILPQSLPLTRPYPTKRMKLWFIKGPFFYAEFNLRLFFLLLFSKANVLHANDLDTLLPNFLVSKLKGIPVVFDSHEYFTEVPELQDRPFVKFVWKSLEKWIFPKLSKVFTVNDSIAHLFENQYGNKPLVIRNIPNKQVLLAKMEPQAVGIPEGMKLLVLQGAGLNIDRGTEEAVLAISMLDDVGLMVIGSGDALPLVKKMVKDRNLESRVFFFPKMEYSRMLQFTQMADIGLSLDKDSNINYRYSLPNKVFDYIHAGIPILASDLVEVKRVVDTWGVGEILTELVPEKLAERIRLMLADQDKLAQYKANTQKAAEILTWEKESSEVLLRLYNGI